MDSKLSNLPNGDAKSQDDTEFESSKTLMPREGNALDEIGALMGNERSMAELQTSIHTRSPGPSLNNKLAGIESISMVAPGGESTYAAH